MKSKSIMLFFVVVLSVVMLCACSNDATTEETDTNASTESVNPGDPIVIMMPANSEYEIIGYMTILMLEKNAFEIENQIDAISGLDMLREMMLSDECDITMGYTGNGMYYMEEEGEPVWKDWQAGYERIRDFDKETNNVDWLAPCPANNTELLAVTQDFATENNIVDMYDFAEYVNDGGYIKLASPQYWVEYSQGLPALEAAYGFTIAEDQLVIGSKAEKEVANNTDGLNCTLIFTTDGIIDELGLYVIQDPLEVPPVYSPCLVVNGAVLEKYPQISTIMDPITSTLTTEILISLNKKVQSDGVDPETVARDYLESISVL